MSFHKLVLSCAVLLALSIRAEAQSWAILTVNPAAYTTGSVALNAYSYFKFSSMAGYRYLTCTNTTTGDADLYVSTSPNVSRTVYTFKSTSTGIEDECISLSPTVSGTYYLAIYGYKATSFRVYVIGYKVATVPSYMYRKLRCPIDDGFRPSLCGKYTSDKYGPFGSPWGNASDAPFFSGHQNYFHNGLDYAAPSGTLVRAAYAGTVVATGDLGLSDDGYSWGKYVVIEHSINGNKFTTAYLHLTNLLVSGQSTLTRGQALGSVVHLSVAGEVDHVHFTIHTGAYRSSNPKSQSGAMVYSYWKDYGGVFINPDVTTNPDLYEGIGIP